MGDKKKTISEIAERLDAALNAANTMDPVTVTAPELDIDDAYAVQLINVEKALARGAKITGKKIGLTSLAMQQMLGVDEPDYGHLFDDMDLKDGTVERGKLIQPKVEGEIAFVLKADVKGPNATAADVMEATDYVVASIELVDSRVRDWKIKLIDTVSDNASSCRYILGAEKVPLSGVSLPEVKMTLYRNGEPVNGGKGADVLGDPAICVAWLANKLWKYGVVLKAGEVILSGALSAAVAADAGDTFEARFSAPLGGVSVRFV